MKQLKVSDQCNGCGACVLQCAYFEEDAGGNALAVEGKPILSEDLQQIQGVIRDCPRRAISVLEVSSTAHTGKAGLRDLLQKLVDKEKALRIPEASVDSLRFSVKDYSINAPYSMKENIGGYSSEGQARAAARDEFEGLCYAPSAFRPILKKLFVEYKLDKLKPYYTKDESEASFYSQYNRSIESFLRRYTRRPAR